MTSPTDLTPDIPTRVHALEVGHEVQATILTQIQAELIESDRLINSVGRLAEGSDALAAALLKVDATAQATTRLGKELTKVKQEHSTTDEIEKKVADAKKAAEKVALERVEALRAERRRATRLVATVLGVTVALLAGSLAFVINSDYHACVQRKVRLDINIALYNDVSSLAGDSPAAARIMEGASALERTRVDCGDLYPIHWGDGL